MELENQIAVVTGASQGIGQAIAIAFAKAGANVAFTYHHSQELAEKTAEMVREAGRESLTGQVDATDVAATEGFMDKVIARFGQVDILVNNVGGADTIPSGGFVNTPLDYWHQQFDKNFFSAVVYCRVALRSMIPRRTGSIINIGSVHSARVINPAIMPYACAKQAMNHLTRNLAVELAAHQIRVNTLAPGLVKTALTQRRYDQEWWDGVKNRIPLGRAGEPTEIGEIAVFLASKRSSYMTGQIIYADGGRSL